MAGNHLNRDKAACLGASTRWVRCMMEHMERCRACGSEVRWDLAGHRFFGFKAGCDVFAKTEPPSVIDSSVVQPGLSSPESKQTEATPA